MKPRICTAVIISFGCILLSSVPAFSADESARYLAKFARDPAPWLHIAAYSEQSQPVYMGATPREIALRLSPSDRGEPILHDRLRITGEEEARQVREALVKNRFVSKDAAVEFEMWPVEDDYGQLTWAFARWRESGQSWQRLNASIIPGNPDPYLNRWPVLPVSLDPKKASDFSLIFDDSPTAKRPGGKPAFGNCIWTLDDGRIMEAWLPVDRLEAYRNDVSKDIKEMGSSQLCRVLPQPARLNGKPATFIVKVMGNEIIWPAQIKWKREPSLLQEPSRTEKLVKSWPANFKDLYKRDLLALASEIDAEFPISKRKVKFSKKNSAEKDNSLQDIVAYLEERYKALGIRTLRQEFSWRGIGQTNLVAVIPGTDPSLAPVVIADHIDTAFSEDISARGGGLELISSPGANDNASATAALLRCAESLAGLKLRRDIWLVHLTGKESPADSLGARHFVGELLREKKDIEGVIILDMIARRESGDRTFQINAGGSPASLRIASVARDAAKLTGELIPEVMTRFDERSNLYRTDALIFSDNGIPVIAVNENMKEVRGPRGTLCGRSDDTAKKLDWDYATDITKAVIEAVAVLADSKDVEARTPQAEPRKLAPEWSVMVYTGSDQPDLARIYDTRVKALVGTPVPDGVELLSERDTEWPDGSVRAIRTASSYAESEIPEQDSASAAAISGFLDWAKANMTGKYKLLVVQGSSRGWRGIIPDNITTGADAKRDIMPLRGFAAAVSASGLKPDVIFLDGDMLGSVEAIDELRGLAPYIIVSELKLPEEGFPATGLFGMLSSPDMTPREFARHFPEEYIKEYSQDGSMAPGDKTHSTVSLAAIDMAKWDIFVGKFKALVAALGASGFRARLAAEPGWLTGISDAQSNVDAVELLKRLPLIVDDVAVRATAAAMLDEIGYPERIDAENAATITLDPAKVRSFELRIEIFPNTAREDALKVAVASWKALNQDLKLPDTLSYDVVDFRENRKAKRELIIKCPDGALKKPVTFRPWLAGARYANLVLVDPAGQISTRKLFRDKDYISVKDFPGTGFILSEAHTQGAPFVHGIAIMCDPSMKDSAEDIPDPITGKSGQEFYKMTSWSQRTGWGELLFAPAPVPAEG